MYLRYIAIAKTLSCEITEHAATFVNEQAYVYGRVCSYCHVKAV